MWITSMGNKGRGGGGSQNAGVLVVLVNSEWISVTCPGAKQRVLAWADMRKVLPFWLELETWLFQKVYMYLFFNFGPLVAKNDQKMETVGDHMENVSLQWLLTYVYSTCCLTVKKWFNIGSCLPNSHNSQSPQCTCPIPHNAPFRTEMCTFLFWMVLYGVWNRCIVGFVRLVYYSPLVSKKWLKMVVSNYHLEN